VKFAFIHAEKAFPVAFMCRQLGVSRSGYYAWRDRGPSCRAQRDDELVPVMRGAFSKYPRGCGSRSLVGALRNAGYRVSRKPRHSKRLARNVVKRDFAVGAPNRIWASDITYLPTKRGWAYLAVVMDLGTRQVVGWSVRPTMEQALVLHALRDALFERRPAPGLVHHSDRGVQYAADDYRALLAEHGMICSMSRKGNCWDNAVVESFFSSLKREMPHDDIAEDWRDAERRVFSYIAGHYNSTRVHSALGYVTPNRYEELQAEA
jgi:transposase InsO family protein